jgi:hypothetical protein
MEFVFQSSINNDPGLYSNRQSPIINGFSGGLCIPIINQQSSIVNEMGGGVDISLFPAEKILITA